MADGWTMIRVRPDTAAWLRNEARHLFQLYQRGIVELEVTERAGGQQGCGVSADQVLRRLIDSHESRKRRRRKAGRNRTRRKQKGDGESLPPSPSADQQP